MNIRRAVLAYTSAPRYWPCSSADLASELGCSWKAMRACLRKMDEEGLIKCSVAGANDVWKLTPKGREEASNATQAKHGA